MKATLIDDELILKLYQLDVTRLEHARDIGVTLTKLHRDEGPPLVEAVDDILANFERVKKKADTDETAG